MSYVEPNSNPILLVDDFIRYAKAHLLTVSGQASVISTYQPPLPPAPSICRWTGYKIPDIQAPNTDTIPASTNFKSDALVTRDRFFKEPDEIDYEQEFRPQGVPNQYTRVDGSTTPNTANTPQTNFKASNDEARKTAEAYLGRSMSDAEWNNLVSLTNAESSTNQTERGWVMGIILNRTRDGFTPAGFKNAKYKFATLIDIISQAWQFQPVTGTRYKPGPIPVFITGPSAVSAQAIYGSTIFLKDVSRDWYYFTSNDENAYKDGTNINFLFGLRKREKDNPPTAKTIGGTIFGK
jgi:hypothetical protein